MRISLRSTAAVPVAAWLVSGAAAPVAIAQEKMLTFYLCLLVAPARPATAPADPAVKAGRLAVEMRTWYGSKGALPQAAQ